MTAERNEAQEWQAEWRVLRDGRSPDALHGLRSGPLRQVLG